MKSRFKKGLAAAVATVAATAGLVVGSAGSSTATATLPTTAVGLINNGTLMCAFSTDKPTTLDWVRAVSIPAGNDDTRFVGIDRRVQDGLLYGVGDKGGIYTIKTPPDVPDLVITKVSQLTVQLYGASFGVDFNPAADRLRVISDNAQNLRHNLNDHTTIEDGQLTTPPTPGPTRGVTAAAYTNNDLDPTTATTLFDIGTLTDQVLIQSPANQGDLAPTGALTVDASLHAGFDIFSDLTGGKAKSVTGFAALSTQDGKSSLYTVNLLNGEVTKVGDFPLAVDDLTLALDKS
jgi:hypothetical protein